MVRSIRHAAKYLGRELTPDDERRIAELERSLEGRQRCGTLTIEEVTAVLERGRQRNASRANE
jgi:hypothetical protein